MTADINQTLCVGKGEKIGQLDKRMYENVEQETVNQLRYLGCVFESSGGF